jgi:hypothetical protein
MADRTQPPNAAAGQRVPPGQGYPLLKLPAARRDVDLPLPACDTDVPSTLSAF